MSRRPAPRHPPAADGAGTPDGAVAWDDDEAWDGAEADLDDVDAPAGAPAPPAGGAPASALLPPRRVDTTLAGLRADLVLGRLFPEYSRSRLQEWIRAGLVRVDGQPVGLRDKLWAGQQAEVEAPAVPQPGRVLPEPVPLDIVYEDDSLLVLHKAAGQVVHPGSGNWSGTLQNGLLYRDPALAAVPRAGIVHRLDKDTSGLMVVARTLVSHIDLVRQLQARTVRRHYAALACGRLSADGSVDAPVGRHPTQRTRMAVVAGGRPAVTHYHVTRPLPGCTLLECRLETGRTHQIRVHLQKLGHALVGDAVYRPSALQLSSLPACARSFPRQALHAFRLGLVHPASGAPMEWQIPLEADLQQLLDELERHAA